MKKNVLALILIVVIVLCPVLTSCGGIESLKDEPLTFYSFNERDSLIQYLKKYNTYCTINDRDEDRVEIVNFDSYEEYEAKLTTEVMAGGGPDIISLSQKLPFEKLIKNNSLADINTIVAQYSEDFTFDDYNKVVMDSGVFDGKRFILPLYYAPDFLVTSSQRLAYFGVDLENATYDTLIEDIKNDELDGYLIDPYMGEEFYYAFIRQFLDVEKGTADFDTDEFKTLAEDFKVAVIGESYDSFRNYDSTDAERKEYLFEGYDYSGRAGSFPTYARAFMHIEGSVIQTQIDGVNETDTLFFPNYSRNGEMSATVEIGLSINANCDKMDKAMKLIDYMLSFEAQSYWCGGRDGDDIYDGSGFLPVNNEVYEASYNNALEAKIDADQNGEMDEFDEEIFAAKNKALSEYYRPLLDSITVCTIYDLEWQRSTYLVSSVMKDIVDSYLKSEITTDKFVARLTDAVKMYLNE